MSFAKLDLSNDEALAGGFHNGLGTCCRVLISSSHFGALYTVSLSPCLSRIAPRDSRPSGR